MIDPRSQSISASKNQVKQAVQLGFYIGSGLGLAVGSAVAVLLGSNLIWQSGGLVVGATLGMCGGMTLSWLKRRLKPAPAPAYRPTGS
ncbi:hypothetical protein ACYFX5_16810 [Bremerella sp. T1]|uniref:hypothetical protein n=1 Tax=Bremerella sp. TYQ1 TaxID=3119568 RepID=UPI001CCF4A95|nr:hypothetical protein [Bremerella volcania]UBM34720.1 hypothetical protein LA756_18760 [Bremerella volcania]